MTLLLTILLPLARTHARGRAIVIAIVKFVTGGLREQLVEEFGMEGHRSLAGRPDRTPDPVFFTELRKSVLLQLRQFRRAANLREQADTQGDFEPAVRSTPAPELERANTGPATGLGKQI